MTEHLDELVTPSGISMLDILDIPRTVNEVADELKAKEGADIVVLLVHEARPPRHTSRRSTRRATSARS